MKYMRTNGTSERRKMIRIVTKAERAEMNSMTISFSLPLSLFLSAIDQSLEYPHICSWSYRLKECISNVNEEKTYASHSNLSLVSACWWKCVDVRAPFFLSLPFITFFFFFFFFFLTVRCRRRKRRSTWILSFARFTDAEEQKTLN